MLNHETIGKLIAAGREDPELLEMIHSALTSFEQYHAAVWADQIYPLVYGGGGLEPEEYRSGRAALDRTRTAMHNALLANVAMLNRMAAQAGLPPVYDGTVSEQQPYRRRTADAVFAYAEFLIKNRT